MDCDPVCSNMKPAIKKSFLGDPRSGSNKEGVETLVLSKTEESGVLFCQRLKYIVKSIQVPDEKEAEPFISQPLNCKTSVKKIISETPVKKYICKLCGMEYLRNLNLVRHMRIHTGEVPYVCELCGKGFRRKDWLRIHSSVHTGNKQKRSKGYSCDECGKKFTSFTELQSHVYKHRGERPFACMHCDKKFFSKAYLRRHHSDSHSANKRFCCPVCGCGFSRLYTMQKHIRTHTRVKPFSCPDCRKNFSNKYCMNVHRKRHLAKSWCNAHTWMSHEFQIYSVCFY